MSAELEPINLDRDNKFEGEEEIEKEEEALEEDLSIALKRTRREVADLRAKAERLEKLSVDLEDRTRLLELVEAKDLAIHGLEYETKITVDAFRERRRLAVREMTSSSERRLELNLARASLATAIFGVVLAAGNLVWNIVNALYQPKAPPPSTVTASEYNKILETLQAWRSRPDASVWKFVFDFVSRRQLSLQAQLILMTLIAQPGLSEPATVQWIPGGIEQPLRQLREAFRSASTVPRSASLYATLPTITGDFVATDGSRVSGQVPRQLGADLIAHVLSELLTSKEPLFM